MLYSMTGYGAAVCQKNGIAVSVEVKSVNNRYFKLSLRLTDGYSSLEPLIEPILRGVLERGTINAAVRIQEEEKEPNVQINAAVIQSYAAQLTGIAAALGQTNYVPSLDKLVFLPGAVKNSFNTANQEEVNTHVAAVMEEALHQALDALQTMRRTEGESMAKDLTANIESLTILIGNIEEAAPNVAALYRQKLKERIDTVLAEQSVSLNDSDLLREVAVFADRCDISEEMVRFRSHLSQFSAAMNAKESCGRKLDFLTQELFRETNTMGSKANDAGIVRYVVEIKTIIERIREQVQNIE